LLTRPGYRSSVVYVALAELAPPCAGLFFARESIPNAGIPDDLPEPPTLADICSYGVDVFCWCNRCHHHAVLPIGVLIAHCGPGLPFRNRSILLINSTDGAWLKFNCLLIDAVPQ
jgi:hypothetical protein